MAFSRFCFVMCIDVLDMFGIRIWLKLHRPVNTELAYESGARKFVQWCINNSRGFTPPTALTVALYLIHMYNTGFSRSSVKTASAAISDMCRYDVVHPTLDPLVSDVRNTIAKISAPPKSKVALLSIHIKIFFCNVDLSSFAQFRNYVMIVIAYKSLFRGSEMSSLETRDVWIDTINLSDGSLVQTLFILLRDWKTRNGRAGRVQLLCADTTNPWKCPVLLFQKYINQLAAMTIPHTFCERLFIAVRPLGTRLSSKHLHFSIKSFALQSNLTNVGLTGHSPRVGGCTASFRAGIQKRIVARQGDWKSDAIELYIEDSLDDRTAVSRLI